MSMETPPTRTCNFCADLNEPGRFKLYRPCDAGTLSCGACTELEKVESAIDKAMQVVGELFERHREIRTRLNRVHDPLVKKIPPEIISYIFQLSMPPFPTDSDLRNMTSAELRAPIILSAVCTAWRRVALSTPQLWTLNKVSLIEDRKRHMKELEGRCGFFHERLRRSGRLPVDICLTANWKASNYPPAIDLVKAIIQCSDRWHLLDLECDRPLCCLLSGASHRAPNLRALRLRLCNDPENMSFVASEARLEEVYLQSTRVSKIDIDWRRVTTIHLSGAKSSDCVEVLRRAPWLERCRFSNWSSWNDTPEPLLNFAVTHNRIRELTLEMPTRFSDAAPFLEEATFPVLRSLTFPGSVDLTQVIVELFRRSRCSMQELTFTDCDDRQLGYILREVPSLQRLTCYSKLDTTDVNEVFSLLAHTTDDGHPLTFLPRLEHMELGISSADEVPWPLLVEIIQPPGSRIPLLRPLQSVKINISSVSPYSVRYRPPEAYIGDLDRLLDVRRSGFNIELKVLPDGERPGYDVLQAMLDPEGWQHVTEKWVVRNRMSTRMVYDSTESDD